MRKCGGKHIVQRLATLSTPIEIVGVTRSVALFQKAMMYQMIDGGRPSGAVGHRRYRPYTHPVSNLRLAPLVMKTAQGLNLVCWG